MLNEKNDTPEYGSDGFTCPNCHAYAHHLWNEIQKIGRNPLEFALTKGLRSKAEIMSVFDSNPNSVEVDDSADEDEFFGNTAVNKLLIDNAIALSTCSKCSKEAFWIDGKIIYPRNSVAPPAHTDMPEEVKEIYNEAKAILDVSPRASAALLRLALEKLLPIVGAKGKTINEMTGDLVSKGLPEEMQHATDGLRIVGNEAIHPGIINIQDNKKVSEILFEILNIIVGRLITEKKRIKKLYDLIPDEKIEGIEKRDSKFIK